MFLINNNKKRKKGTSGNTQGNAFLAGEYCRLTPSPFGNGFHCWSFQDIETKKQLAASISGLALIW